RPQSPGRAPGGAGTRRGQSGTELDPLVGLDDPAKPLRSKLLAVPALRERYLAYVKEIAQRHLDWKTLGPMVAANRALIEDELRADTRKISSFDAFELATGDEAAAPAEGARREPKVLRTFADKRRAFLLGYTPKDLPTADRGNAR
ncbi:MAG: CotH kinase family protein, partial [Phycisphaerales bacterium]|nr:CotH kinase family protein [Phycisphaerales bacterium]